MFYRIENKELDLLAAYNRKEGPKKSTKALKLAAVPVLTALLFGSGTFAVSLNNKLIQQNIDDVEISNQALRYDIEKCDEEAYNQLQILNAQYTALQQADALIASLPKITQKKINDALSAMYSGMKLKSLSFVQKEGKLSIHAESFYVTNIEKYVRDLKKNPAFLDVNYSGYSQISNTTSYSTGAVDPETGEEIMIDFTETSYSFIVTITIGGE